MTVSTRELAIAHYARLTEDVDMSSEAFKSGKAPTDEENELYTAAMLVCAAADGELHVKEYDWIVGHQACFGVPESVMKNMESLKTKWSYEQIIEKIKGPKMKYTRRLLVFHCISACAADGVLHPKEIASIRGVAAALELPEDQFDELHDIYKKQQAVNEEIFSCLWKDGNPWK